MKPGDLALDTGTKRYVVIVSRGVEWKDLSGNIHLWDYEVSADGKIYYADSDELQQIFCTKSPSNVVLDGEERCLK